MKPTLRTIPTLTVQPATFPEVLERLWVSRHTGRVVVHMAGGVARTVEIEQQAERIVLDAGRDSCST